MRTITISTIVILASLLAKPLLGEVVLKTDNLRLTISQDAKLTSLKAQPDSIEFASKSAASEPIAKLFRGGKEFPATKVELTGNLMTVGFEAAGVKAVFEITTKKEYLAFNLLSISGEAVDRIEFMRLAIKKLPYIGYWINVAYDDDFGICLCAGNVRTDALMSERALYPDESQPEKYDKMAAERLQKRDHVVMRATAQKEVGLVGAEAVLFAFPRPKGIAFLDTRDPFLDVMEMVERDFDMPLGAKFRRDPLQSASWIEVGGLTPGNVEEYIKMGQTWRFPNSEN